ncbi:LPXTG cell wall anchor domain-containing protein [Micromonospora maritima]|uniref:LPXTG cell wall anchor domain-containing protein n=1 Tax=Micromonospora maritima TaxID=986711 RepID=UPI001FE5E902|nr:LPXTG cell wall anchor domain-containing protein [Micromonospora maritima]
MPQRRRAAVTAAVVTALLGLATPAWATGKPHNPKGDNGTVKIDGAPFSDRVDNQPHVDCDLELEFFNFDKGQRATVTLRAQPPSGSRDRVVWSRTDVVISDDPAAGAENDHDAVIRLSADDLDLAGLTAHPKQGYHLKLDVDLADGRAFDDKHKVFWLTPCASSESPTPTPSTPDDTTPTPTPGGSGNPPGSGTPTPGVPTGPGGGGGGLPLTGVAVTSLSLTGLALIGGGALLLALRRRRDRITFTS